MGITVSLIYFNPLRREGGDYQELAVKVMSHKFQSTPPRGRRPETPDECTGCKRFQSTPPRGRRQMMPLKRRSDFNISIHSAARAETSNIYNALVGIRISIHSAARAETL